MVVVVVAVVDGMAAVVGTVVAGTVAVDRKPVVVAVVAVAADDTKRIAEEVVDLAVDRNHIGIHKTAVVVEDLAVAEDGTLEQRSCIAQVVVEVAVLSIG